MEEKCVKMPKIEYFWAKIRRWYRYQRSGTGIMMQWAIGIGTTQTGTDIDWQWITGTGTGQSGIGTTTSSNPILTYFCTVKSRICIPMFRDPKKRIMGVQIRIELSEKRIVPRRLGEFVFGQT